MTAAAPAAGPVTPGDRPAGRSPGPTEPRRLIERRFCPVDLVELVAPDEDPLDPDNAVVVLRADAAYCSPRCRQAASRRARGLRHGFGGTVDRRARRARAAAALPVTGPTLTLGGRAYRQTTAELEP